MKFFEVSNNTPKLKLIRLVTGEDVISEYTTISNIDGDYYILHNPMKVVYISNPEKPNRISVSLMNWIFPNLCEEQTFNIHPNDILTMGNPAKDIAEYYYELIREKWMTSEPTEEELKKLEEEDQLPVSEEELEQIKNLMSKSGPEKKKLLH